MKFEKGEELLRSLIIGGGNIPKGIGEHKKGGREDFMAANFVMISNEFIIG